MTNYEKFTSKIIELISRGEFFAVVNGYPCACIGQCDDCDLKYRIGGEFQSVTCKHNRGKWLRREYIEKPKLTKAEMGFCQSLRAGCYLAKDQNDYLGVFSCKPERCCGYSIDNGFWHNGSDGWCYKDKLSKHSLHNIEFPFITWDSEPWSVEDLLKLEVIDDDN